MAVLEEVPMAAVTAVERRRLAGEEVAPDRRQRHGPDAE